MTENSVNFLPVRLKITFDPMGKFNLAVAVGSCPFLDRFRPFRRLADLLGKRYEKRERILAKYLKRTERERDDYTRNALASSLLYFLLSHTLVVDPQDFFFFFQTTSSSSFASIETLFPSNRMRETNPFVKERSKG